jgi:hypothetical protein
MYQEVETNQIPMLLVPIGWRILHILIAAVEVDTAKGIAINNAPE